MTDLLDTFAEVLEEGLVSRTLRRRSRWVEHRRIMGEPLPGNYSFKYHPWCRELHDAQSSYISVMKGAQLGVTEVAINVAFHTVDVLKRDVLYVLPTALNASDFSKSRFNTALLHSPYLSNLFTDTNTVGLKQAGGVNLYIRGSRGDSNLKSIPVSVLLLDEADEMDQKQIWLALERLSGQIHKFVYALSTPTIPKRGIHLLYEQGTQEHFRFICPHCSRHTELIYPDCLVLCGDTITDPDVGKSHLVCKECKHPLQHEAKMDWLGPTGYWEPTVKVDDDHRSFYVNQLYSYTVSPKELATAYFRGLGDEAANVEFHNSKLGLPFIPDGGQVTSDEIDKAVMRTRYTKSDQRPARGNRCIVMGVDQGKFLHVVITEYLQLPGVAAGLDLNAATTAKVLWEGKLPGDRFDYLDHMMVEWQAQVCVIDADPQINDARRFARRFPDSVYLCRYRRGQTGKEISVAEEETNAPIATVDRTNWFDASMGRFHSNRVQLPDDVSNEFKENVCNLIRTYEKDENDNPKAVYLKTGPDHFAHAFNYCEIGMPIAAGVSTGEDITEKVL